MDNVVQEEGSSSPSVNLLITSITPHRKGALPVDQFHLEDGASFYCSPSLANDYGLENGKFVNREIAEELSQKSWLAEARKKALSLLTRREHSFYELQQKLILVGCPRNYSAQVVDHLAKEGLQDDERFAEIWLAARLRRQPESINRLELRLSEHRIAKTIFTKLVRNFCAAHDIYDIEEHACLLAREKYRRQGIRGEDLQKKLLAKGFRAGLIRSLED